MPPAMKLRPITRSTLMMIEPTSDALARSTYPLLIATMATMSSVAFPKVASRKADRPGPERMASSSVARPISRARGIKALAAPMKIIHDGASTILPKMAMGAPIRKMRAPFSIRLRGRRVLKRPSFPVPPVMLSLGAPLRGSSSRSTTILPASLSSSSSGPPGTTSSSVIGPLHGLGPS